VAVSVIRRRRLKIPYPIWKEWELAEEDRVVWLRAADGYRLVKGRRLETHSHSSAQARHPPKARSSPRLTP
jgi:hypothetical protein